MISCRRCVTIFVCGSKSMLLEGKTSRSNVSWLAMFMVLFAFASCQRHSESTGSATGTRVPPRSTEWPVPQNASPQLRPFLASAIEQTRVTTGYDPAYVKIDYPGGDVPPETGVCSDVLIRAFRKTGIDLQRKSTKTWALPGPRTRNAGERPDPTVISIIAASRTS